VLDLGAAPGSWSLYAAERIGRRGRVVAVDLQEMSLDRENVTVVRGDVLAPVPDGVVLREAPYDVVLSDMAPSTTGSKVSDQARSFDLFMKALDVAGHLGKPGATFVGKIFMSGDFPAAKKAVSERFETCRVIKPEGTRPNSSEVYVVGTKLRASDPAEREVSDPP
jgi:23S rRNA (uridine2552-2'-O)-methyltransferase